MAQDRDLAGGGARALPWLLAALLMAAVALILSRVQPWGNDFTYFWIAGDKVLAGSAGDVYDLDRPTGSAPYPMGYPPPLLLLVVLFGAMPFGLALAAWLAGTGLLYVLAARAPLRIALANPAAAINAIYGQTGFMTAALMLAGARQAARRPWLAGGLLGAMVLKPHLALFIPLALVAGRHWAALGAAVLTATAMLLVAALALGPAIYGQFFAAAGHYAGWLWKGAWSWSVLASPYAFVRRFGIGHDPALMLHGLVAAGAALLVWRAWREDRDGKVAVLASASLLGSPYLFAYDAVLLVAPLALFAAEGRWRWALAVAAMMTVQFLAIGSVRELVMPRLVLRPPNLTPIAALLALTGSWLASRPPPARPG